jgi:hypothetical protein
MYGDTKIEKGKGLVAMVLDPRGEFHEIVHPVKIEPDGRQMALIKVVSEDGGFVVTSNTPSDKGGSGLIRAKVHPVGVAGKAFDPICHYD